MRMTMDWKQANYTYAIFYNISSSRLVTGFVTIVIWRIPLLEQELLTLPEYLGLPALFSTVHVSRTLVFCVVFCRSLFVLLFLFNHCVVCTTWWTMLLHLLISVSCFVDPFVFFGHCIVCCSVIYGIWLPLWCLQTLLKSINIWNMLNYITM